MPEAARCIHISAGGPAEAGADPAAQREAILAGARRRGWHLVALIEDAGYSGKSMERPGIALAFETLRERRADTLVVSKVDRPGLLIVDIARLMDCATHERWALVALDVGVHTTAPAGEPMATVMATFARFERRLIALRTREALAAKRAEGVRLGRPRTVPDEVVERIRRDHAAGATLAAIADRLNHEEVSTARGGARWYPSTVRSVLRQEPL